ncbi:LysE family translocator [Rubeoparvulum massiliense]|uniref:LysE family translocator n=1 Tax=Rubeoparvulum massiliense TaxID=1631346 RepID=UPI00065E9617|nr:LysE family transporter [Rubeoparvulum massiliense]
MFMQVFLVGILAAISPGPDFFVVMKNSLSYGRRIGMATALGIGSALLIHITYTIAGFSILLQQWPALFGLIQLLGAFYLIWLGLHAIRSAPSNNEKEAIPLGMDSVNSWQGFRDGFLCNVLNPKAALFFLSIFSQFIGAGSPNYVHWIYGGEVIAAVILWFLLVAYLVSSPHFRHYYEQWRHWFDRILGAVLLFFAGRILLSALSKFF